MKILIADQFSELGGAQRLVLELLPALEREGWNILLAVPGNGPLRGRAEELGIRCEEIACGPFESGSKSGSDLVRFAAQFPKLRKQLRRLVDDFRPDLLYVNGPRVAPAACSLGAHGPPIIFHMHSYLKQRYAAALTGRFLRHARASIIGNCHFVLNPLREYLHGLSMEVIYNGVHDCGFQERRTRIERIGIIGRICPEKGQKVFVEAARLVHRTLPQTTFVICGGTQFSGGSSESYFREVRELAAGLPVEFTGWRDDLSNVLHSLDLLVVASLPLSEATTRVIPEAYSAGVPVLASNLPGICEILKESNTGFLFAAGHADALASRIRELTADPPEMITAVVANARLAFEERFSTDVFQQQMIRALERAAKPTCQATP